MNEAKKVAANKSTHVTTKAPDKAAAVKTLQTDKSIPKHSRRVSVSPGQHNEMIAEAAYYRAEQRGFSDGDPITDWLWAEAEIDKEP